MTGINLTNINDHLNEVVNIVEEQFQSELANFDAGSATSADLIQLQVGMQKWTIATQLQTNTLKTVGDGLKNTVSNIR